MTYYEADILYSEQNLQKKNTEGSIWVKKQKKASINIEINYLFVFQK